jgi:hypothetical protein
MKNTQADFDNGVREGIRFGINLFAWWKDGKTYIGQQRPDGTGERTAAEAVRVALEEFERARTKEERAKAIWR